MAMMDGWMDGFGQGQKIVYGHLNEERERVS